MNRVAAMASVTALFLVGVLIGGFATYLYLPKTPTFRPSGRGGFSGEMFVEELKRELSLTPDQIKSIDEIIEQAHVEGEALRREMLPRVRGLLAESRDRMREVLTSEQQVRFDELQEMERGRSERMLLGPGGRGRPGGPRIPRGRGRRRPPVSGQP